MYILLYKSGKFNGSFFFFFKKKNVSGQNRSSILLNISGRFRRPYFKPRVFFLIDAGDFITQIRMTVVKKVFPVILA
jgi:hypothetical protein